MNIAIIPARAGSKGLPNKNILLLGKKSLVHHALHSALQSGIFDQVILSTDIPSLLEEKGDWITHKRNPNLTKDSTPMSPVILDVLQRRKTPDRTNIWLLQPTSPFRIADDYAQISLLLQDPDVKSVISVTQVGDHHPSRHYTISSTFHDLKPILGRLANFENRQDLRAVYERNGLYYVTTAGVFKKQESFYVPRCKAYIVEKKRSVNINDEDDWEYARFKWQTQ